MTEDIGQLITDLSLITKTLNNIPDPPYIDKQKVGVLDILIEGILVKIFNILASSYGVNMKAFQRLRKNIIRKSVNHSHNSACRTVMATLGLLLNISLLLII